MGWQEYYRYCNPDSLRATAHLYERVIDGVVSPDNGVIPPDRPLTFVLGGFYPFNRTPETFQALCKKLHPNPKDKHIFLDKNEYPLRRLNPRFHRQRVQADLTFSPFPKGSIDFLILDSTINFMDDCSVVKLGGQASEVLSPTGLMLITRKPPMIPFFERLLSRWENRTKTYIRSDKELMGLLSALRTVWLGEDDNYQLFVFSRNDSDKEIYPEFRGLPVACG